MNPVSIQTSEGIPIHSVDDWFRLAPPKKGSRQWKDGRSAKELAKAWFRTGTPQVPEELEGLFESHPATQSLVIERGIPEMQTRLDDFRGEKRNHDLILLGHAGSVSTLVAIEAKADEEFGPVIQDYLEKTKGTSSNVPHRIDLLSRSIFGRPIDEELGQIRYQLLHGLGGTLIEAKNQGATQAVFVVHEFISGNAAQENVDRNAADFERFMHALSGGEEAVVSEGILIGPIRVPGGEFVPADVPVLIGKVTTVLK
jgi:hypothetical protein